MKQPRYSVGDRVRYQDMEGVVEEILGGPSIHYRVAFAHTRRVVPEYALAPADGDPASKLLTGDFGEGVYFDLRARALYIKAAYTLDDLVSLTNARVELKPHQVFVAHRVVQNPRPRFLLADEVGLGKTIEAGMILKELRARGLVDRVLVLAPASLVLQWQTEFRKKFNEDFVIYDRATLQYLEREKPGENPWGLHSRIITSLQLARQEERRSKIAEAIWDLVIVDEAHHLRRYIEGYDEHGHPKVRNTQSYLLGEAVSGKTRSLLFLTATPLQLRTFEFYSLLVLLDPALFPGFTDFERFRGSTLREVNQGYALLNREVDADTYHELRRLWEDLRRSHPSLPVLPPLAGLNASTRQACQAALADLHVLSRVMSRSRRREIGGSPRASPA